MRSVLLATSALLLLACGGRVWHVRLSEGGSAALLSRVRPLEAAAAPDGRVLLSGHYSDFYGERQGSWLPRNTNTLLASFSASGRMDWLVAAPGHDERPIQRIAVGGDGATWVLARTIGPFVEGARKHTYFGRQTRLVLARVSGAGRIERQLPLDELGASGPEALPLAVAATSDGGVVAVVATRSGVTVLAFTRTGDLRYSRRYEHGQDREPSDGGVPVVFASDGATLWLAGSNSSLALRPDDLQPVSMVVALALATGEPRAVFHPPFYVDSLALAGDAVALAWQEGEAARLTLHDPADLALRRSLLTFEHARIAAIAADGHGHLLAVVNQGHHGTLRYGSMTVRTSTTVPVASATIGLRVPLAGGEPEVVGVARSQPVGSVWGRVSGSAIVPLDGALAVVGSYSGGLLLGDDGPFDGTFGTMDLCTHEDYFHQPGCDEVVWEAASTYIVRWSSQKE